MFLALRFLTTSEVPSWQLRADCEMEGGADVAIENGNRLGAIRIAEFLRLNKGKGLS
jgi:hypothetical protein